MKLKSLLLHLFIFIALGAPLAFAISPSSISINVAPANPAPYQNVTITLQSFSANLDSVSIAWFVDGKNALSGIGKKSFSITAKAANVETRVEAKIFLPDGEIDKTVIIRPGVMVLLWQANDSYVPPFYKGKALPSADSEVKVVAMPEARNGSEQTNIKNMIYGWKKDFTNDQESSGYGKNFYIYTNDYLEDSNNIGVTASTADQSYSSESNITIGTNQIKILFYKDDKILGTIWEKILDDPHNIQGPEIVKAIPYFLSPKEIQNPRVIWTWSINGNRANVPNFRRNVMPLQVQEGASGTSRLKLEIENMDKIFQTASKEINIEF